MDTARHEAPEITDAAHLWECPLCGAVYPSVWLARECHDPTLEGPWELRR
ncbi:hypothetical protein [Microbacterium thalassium]|uniref:Uncharacterized protein n=1 Tax=Microbacterium thalassium TaxID=362649 RepID=A0A7X0KW73_9MICO|nr:hypothetical protein [Microbacterium thalassium]MBB6392986.1 hypothetical protein [Microbacterium thalassium]GLK22782.1 hypothetical protein GCM10017607_01000 [Microbacterium thalassium]